MASRLRSSLRTTERGSPMRVKKGMWFGVSDDVIVPTVMRPVQFHDLWSRPATVPPERRLALAVVEEALNDLARHRFARHRYGQRMYWQAYKWIAADDHSWPFSFVNL